MRQPLADRLRPQNLSEFVGQEHIISMIQNMTEPRSMIFYGPSGTGKTSLAQIIAKQSSQTFRHLNATNAGTADIKNIRKLAEKEPVLLYLDEIQSFNKKQQQSLLEMTENGSITLIAATTENPMFYVIKALLSRCTVFEFKPLSYNDIGKIIHQGVITMGQELKTAIQIDDQTHGYLVYSAGGDARKALTAIETLIDTAPLEDNKKVIKFETARNLLNVTITSYDPHGDMHNDLQSALQKSIRGSDPDAALYYLARLLIVGDLPTVCRRLMVTACEDVGLAYPNIIPIVKSCIDTAMYVGLPEAKIPLADAVVLTAIAPKSASGHDGIAKAMDYIKTYGEHPVPRHLQNTHYDDVTENNPGQHYLYPHEHENHWVKQQYLPDALVEQKFYEPGDNMTEKSYLDYWNRIKGV